ncbi:serine/arginine repetitive matrix protein 1-like [Thrips palmi]|uniref:Serine/arginine repetitive matrix protein 1-like n=1 Tax=Thrips palmi TaxID=161013 RepID=A0A6P8ZV02_THRPL|nr:serine/arginine repetitive matrix protein 1-like [Thrips palmi]
MSRYDRSPRSRSSQSRLRMDSYSSSSNGRSGLRGKSPKRNELNNVMRKARQDNSKPSIYWNKKLLEAEEKDPNRWRHSGYKELYADGSPSNRRSRSRSRSRSHVRPRSKSRSRSNKSRSISPRGGLGGLRRAPLGRDRIRSPPLPARPSPPPRQRSRDRERERERERERDRERDRLRERERERERAREPIRKDQGRRSRPRRPQTPEPPPPKPSASRRPEPMDVRRKGRASPLRAPSASGSSRSVSSCSDSVCSVCLPKSKGAKKATTPPPQGRRHTPPTRRTPPPRRLPAASPPTIPRRPVVSPPPSDPRGPPPSPPPAARRAAKAKRRAEREKAKLKGMSKRRRAAAGLAMVKLEGVPRHHSPPMPGSDSDSCSTSSRSSMGAPRLTLSERFGKMAQWSENRRDLDGVRNMRITRESEGTDFKVVIDEDDDGAPYRPLSPMPVSDRRVGLGFFPEALHAAPVGLEAWDDVRVRFQYYKDRGYLRDLTLDDYMKWEEWWYKYQEWLEAERYYEQWHAMRGHLRGGRRGKRHRI